MFDLDYFRRWVGWDSRGVKSAKAEIERLQAYKAARECEDAAMDIDIDRIMANLPPLTPGTASVALSKLRSILGMELEPISEVVAAGADEIERLRVAITRYVKAVNADYDETTSLGLVALEEDRALLELEVIAAAAKGDE